MNKMVFGVLLILVAAVLSLSAGSLIESTLQVAPVDDEVLFFSAAQRSKPDGASLPEADDQTAADGKAQTAADDDGDNNVAIPSAQLLPGKDIDYALKISESDFHNVSGLATSVIGVIKFRSKLLPSNEVTLELILEREEGAPLVFKAYFDLANFVMELDGAGAVLDADHRALLRVSSAHITSFLIEKFEGIGLPEHGFMLVQMLSYWSHSPEGYVHEKHIAANN